MYKIKGFIPRTYQESIIKTAINNNTLVVLPTGMGKTAIAIMLSIERLNKFPDSKILILAPTKPLSEQHLQTFKQKTTINPEKIILLTGMIRPEIRKELWKNSTIVIATPQTIESDLKNKRISLEDTTLLIVDECHRSKEKFANTIVSQEYIKKSKNQKILALTASPGSTKKEIEEICDNLNINAIEIRTELDTDIKEYIKEKETEWVLVDLPQEFKDLKNLVNESYKDKMKKIKRLGFSKPLNLINKKDLLLLQKRFQNEILGGSKTAFYSISLIAQAIKLEHAITLLETQGINPLKEYWKKLEIDQSKAAKNILDEINIKKSISLTNTLIEENFQHPKTEKLIEIIKTELNKNPDSKIILFANYRFTVNELFSILSNIDKAKPIRLIGQKEGLTQKQQIQTITDFEQEQYNILICTSIGEEGLHLSTVDLAIFYESVPSVIRSVQRRGRVGRVKIGKIIYIITRSTKDEAFYWSSFQKEKKMKDILHKMQKKNKEEQTIL